MSSVNNNFVNSCDINNLCMFNEDSSKDAFYPNQEQEEVKVKVQNREEKLRNKREAIKKIKQNRVKTALSKCQPNIICKKEKDGIDKGSYSSLINWGESLGDHANFNLSHKRLWISSLWEESFEYFENSLDYVVSQKNHMKKFLPTLLLWAEDKEGLDSKQSTFMTTTIQKLEEHSFVYGCYLRDLLINKYAKGQYPRHLVERLQVVFKYSGQSETLFAIVVDLLLQLELRNRLPEEIKQLQLGGWKAGDCVEGVFTEVPSIISRLPKAVVIRSRVLKDLALRPKICECITEKEVALVLGDSYIADSIFDIGYCQTKAISLML